MNDPFQFFREHKPARMLITQSTGILAVHAALEKGRAKHGNMVSPHEALAVIREEYLEMEREVFRQTIDRRALRKELTHLGAMAARAIEDLELDDDP